MAPAGIGLDVYRESRRFTGRSGRKLADRAHGLAVNARSTAMRITPLDVRKQEFKRGMRGYDADEVRAFLITLADEYEAVLVDNRQLRERMLELDEKLAEYRNLERTLRDTLMTAEKMTQEARETARKQGELLIEEARQRVENVLAEGRTQLSELRREALAVHREKETFLGRFQSMAEAQIQFIEAHRGDFKAMDSRLLDQTESTFWAQVQPEQTQPAHSVESAAQPFERPETNSEKISSVPRPIDVHDQWRDYAIEQAPKAPANEGTCIADVVNDAAGVAADQPATDESAAPDKDASGSENKVQWPWPPADESSESKALAALDEVSTQGSRDRAQP
jgi:cell division initiation protein